MSARSACSATTDRRGACRPGACNATAGSCRPDGPASPAALRARFRRLRAAGGEVDEFVLGQYANAEIRGFAGL